ncbi:MAG TPA: methyltransferase domain-containing protein [Alphaproteobacteria bacterium]
MSNRDQFRLAPLAIFVYKRPKHTRRMLESLRANPDFARSHVTVYCDGPKNDAERSAVDETRRVVEQLAPHARIVARETNMGLAKSIITGVTELCAAHGRVIVCEDDLVFTPFALDYFNDALDFYAEQERVMHIAGYVRPARGPLPAAFLGRETFCYGWAIWQRAWEKFEVDAKVIIDWIDRRRLHRRFDVDGAMPYWQMLNLQAAGKLDSWAIRWYGTIFMHDGLSLNPGRALVRNEGFDGTGVHCSVTTEFDVPLATEPLPPSKFPRAIQECEVARQALAGSRYTSAVPVSSADKTKGMVVTDRKDRIDALNLINLEENAEKLEKIVRLQQKVAASNPQIQSLLHATFLQEDRDGDFARFLATREFATIQKILGWFGITQKSRLCEVGGGSGFLSWALHASGFRDISLLEPNVSFATGTGYLRSRPDADGLRIYRTVEDFNAAPDYYDAVITRNCIHHFRNISYVAAQIRQKMAPGGKWFSFREWFADTPQELQAALANHPYCQPYGIYEWPFPAYHYADAIEIVGFRLIAVVPAGYANGCLATYSENPGPPELERFTALIDHQLQTDPDITVRAFWDEVRWNKFEGAKKRLFTRPQAMIFEKIPI